MYVHFYNIENKAPLHTHSIHFPKGGHVAWPKNKDREELDSSRAKPIERTMGGGFVSVPKK